MILGFHFTLSCYGHWLPNDPRGSGSKSVWSDKLFLVGGKATKVDTRRSVAHVPHDVCLRMKTKESLKYPPILFSNEQIEIVSAAIEKLTRQKNISLYACTVASDHVHLLIGPAEIDINELILLLKEVAVAELLQQGLHPRTTMKDYQLSLSAAASVWSVGAWKVFITSEAHLKATRKYIENHHL